MEGDEVLHNEFHITEPTKVEMLCTLVEVNSLSSASSLALISNNNEVSAVTDTIDVLITPKSPPTCHEILNLTIPFRESNGLSGISLIRYGACYLQAGTFG